MSGKLLTEDATISGENKSSVENETPSNKDTLVKCKRKKRKKNQNGLKDSAKVEELQVETSMKSKCLEQGAEQVNAAEVGAKTYSGISESNVSSTPSRGKRKRKAKQKKDQDLLKRNGTEHDSLKVISSKDGALLEGDVSSQPLANKKCLNLDDKEHDAEAQPNFSEDTSVGLQEKRHDAKESNDDDSWSINNCHAPQIGDAVHVPDIKAIDSTCNQNVHKDYVKLEELETSIKSNCQEQSAELVKATEVAAKTHSGISQPNTASPSSRKRKRRYHKKGQDPLKINGTEHDIPNVISSGDGALLEGDVFSQPLENKCLKLEDIINDADVKPIFSEDTSVGQQKKRHDAKESNDDDTWSIDNFHGPQIGDAVHVPVVKAIDSTCKQDVSYLPKILDQLCCSPNDVNISSMNNLLEHVDADNIVDEENSARTYKRTRQKASCSRENSVEISEQGESSLLPELMILPNESRDTCLNCPDEALAPGCLSDALKREELTRHDTSMIIGEDGLLENSLGVPSDLEHASMENMNSLKDPANGDGSVKDVLMADLAGGNYEQAESSKLNANLNVLCGMHSTEEQMQSSEKASTDGSAQVPSIATLDQNTQTTVEDSVAFLPELGSVRVNVTQPINPSLGKVHSSCSRKKLLVLDVNGLLADIVPNEQLRYYPDAIISTKAVFKRPFCDDFLKFCFERFNVGVWSSRTKKNVQRVLDFLIRRKGFNLLFCWDQSHCTETGYNTIENKDKPLVLKELKKLWEKQDPDLPWEIGDYDESNTLLLDDSPYKALRNPPNTAIFPYTYAYWHKTDNALAAKGHLRMYLERLAEAEHVQKFVEQHPFGQRPITKTDSSWPFYQRIIGATFSQPEAGGNTSLATKSQLEAGGNTSFATKSQLEAGEHSSAAPHSQMEAGDNRFSAIPESQPVAGDNSSAAPMSQLVAGNNNSAAPKSQPEAGDKSSSAIEPQLEAAGNDSSAPKSEPEVGDNSSSATKSILGENTGSSMVS